MYVCIVCTTCGYSLSKVWEQFMQFNRYAKYLPCSSLLVLCFSFVYQFLHCVFYLHLHSREINFLMHFRRFFPFFQFSILLLYVYVRICISFNYIRVYMAVLKNFPFSFVCVCVFFRFFTCFSFIFILLYNRNMLM